MAFTVHLDYDGGVPVYRQIFDAVLGALAAGELRTDDQLPTIHALAAQLEINPNTVARAYRELEGAGHIVSKRGLGSFPAPEAVKPPNKKKVLRAIYAKAIAEAARYRISPTELVESFRRQACDA